MELPACKLLVAMAKAGETRLTKQVAAFSKKNDLRTKNSLNQFRAFQGLECSGFSLWLDI